MKVKSEGVKLGVFALYESSWSVLTSQEKKAAVSRGLVLGEQLAVADAGCSPLGPPVCWEVSAVPGSRQ